MSMIRVQKPRYSPKEAHMIFKMLQDPGMRDIALNTLLNNPTKRFAEDDRRELFRELRLIKVSIHNAHTTVIYTMSASGTYTMQTGTSHWIAQTAEETQVLDDVKRVEWVHGKRAYREHWQEKRKKNFRRSAKNHHS